MGESGGAPNLYVKEELCIGIFEYLAELGDIRFQQEQFSPKAFGYVVVLIVNFLDHQSTQDRCSSMDSVL